ncbi:hypothetical protein C8R45DRAFT_1074301 [Mycena sanguinolenta]|nr:hypothetical protein C8R45DRAFT_1074301 [Mycena sanguinolenta]
MASLQKPLGTVKMTSNFATDIEEAGAGTSGQEMQSRAGRANEREKSSKTIAVAYLAPLGQASRGLRLNSATEWDAERFITHKGQSSDPESAKNRADTKEESFGSDLECQTTSTQVSYSAPAPVVEWGPAGRRRVRSSPPMVLLRRAAVVPVVDVGVRVGVSSLFQSNLPRHKSDEFSADFLLQSAWRICADSDLQTASCPLESVPRRGLFHLRMPTATSVLISTVFFRVLEAGTQL